MPVDPTTDPDFMKAAPHEQMAYLSQTDPGFAKATPQDQMGYLMHIRGLSPAISGPANNRQPVQTTSEAAMQHPSTYTGPGAWPNPEAAAQAGESSGYRAAVGGPLALAATAMGGPAVATGIATMAAKHPILTMMAGQEAISAARKLPFGKYIPPYAELLPMLLAGKGAPESEPTSTRPPPVSYSTKVPAAAEAAGVPAVQYSTRVPIETPTSAPVPPVRYSISELQQKAAEAPPPVSYSTKSAAKPESVTPPAITYSTQATTSPQASVTPPVRYSINDIRQKAAIAGRAEGQTAESLESPYQVQNIPVQGAKVPAVQGTLPNLPEMQPSQSTTISQHGYDPAKQQMTVQFKNGNIYSYSGVPQKVFDQYQASESQGSFHANNIKGRYKTDLIGKVKPTPGQKVAQALGGSQQ